MKILICHNFYQQSGGEDQVFYDEVKAFEAHGHEVVVYARHNDDIQKMSVLALAANLIWSRRTYKEVRALLRQHRPDIVQVYNSFPLLSPSVFYAARAEGVPVVWGLNNQRLMCPSSNFTLQGRLCTACLGKQFAFSGVWHRCYRKSFLFTAGVAFTSAWYCWIGTWSHVVSGYIASTQFYKNLFVRHGLPVEKIHVKAHMVAHDPGLGVGDGDYALFIGRLDPEKGAQTLLNAWKVLQQQGRSCPLKIRGDGQLRETMQSQIEQYKLKDITFTDRMSRDQLFDLMKGARFLVWPSHGYYETFGLVAFETYACGRPVIASNIGVLAEHVRDKETGLLFSPGDPQDLAQKVAWAWEHPLEMKKMGACGRSVYEKGYTAEVVYKRLMEIYQQVLAEACDLRA